MHYYRLHLVFTDYFSLLTITAHYYRLQTYYYLFIVFYSIRKNGFLGEIRGEQCPN